MDRDPRRPYLAMGLTAFCVLAGALLLFFALFHLSTILGFFGRIAGILRPSFLGMVLAFLLVPVHRRALAIFSRRLPAGWQSSRRVRGLVNLAAIVCSLLLAGLLIYLLLAMVIPQVWQSIVDLVTAIPDYITDFQSWLRTFLEDNPEIQAAVLSVYGSAAVSLEQWLNSDILPNLESVTAALEWLRSDLLSNVTGVVSGVSTVVVAALMLLKDVLIAIIVSVYVLARKEKFAAQSKKIVYSLMRPDHADQVVREARNAYRIMSGFINGKIVDSLIIGIICLACCNLFHFPYPALLSTIVGVTNVIPFFGPFIGAIPCILLIFIIDPLQSLYFALFILALQQFDGNILGPKILGDSTGLDSFWVLFSILLFGGLWGFAGMIVGVPLFAVLYDLVRKGTLWGLARKGQDARLAAYHDAFCPPPDPAERREKDP